MNREELIQAYLHHRLAEDKREEVEEKIASDPTFKEEYEQQVNLNAGFSSLEQARIKTKLQGFENEIKDSGKKPNFKEWLVAASILFIVGLGLTVYFTQNQESSTVLYASYFEPYKNVIAPITRGEKEESQQQTAFMAYEKKEYSQAASAFQSLYSTTQKGFYLLYEANAYMALNQTDKAILLLEKHLAMQDPFVQKTRWYLALAYLKEESTPKAIPLLKKLVQEKEFKAAEAQRILNALD